MSVETFEKELTKLEKYLIKNGRKEFVDEIRKGDPGLREAKLLSLAKHRQHIKSTKAQDVELKEISEKKSVLEAPYNDQIRMNDKLCRFIHLINKEEGLDENE